MHKKIMMGMVTVVYAFTVIGIVVGAEQPKIKGLVASWNFDEGKGEILKDASGNGNEGEIYGAKWVAGKSGNALEFNGTDNYVQILVSSSIEDLTSSSFSFEAWAKPASVPPTTFPPGPHTIVARPGYHTDIQYTSSKTFAFECWNADNKNFKAVSKETYEPNVWHHIVGVFDLAANKVLVYVDGNLSGSADFSGSPRAYSESFYIGCAAPTSEKYPFWFKGAIDNVRMYNRALTADEVKAFYTSSK